jgi:phosphatidylserine/phosphatidylglycerophosphate/cardiolipin synthase-like enzyme
MQKALAAGVPAFAGSPVEIHYSPAEQLDRIDAELIDNAETSINIAAYVLSDWQVIDALDNAAREGRQGARYPRPARA